MKKRFKEYRMLLVCLLILLVLVISTIQTIRLNNRVRLIAMVILLTMDLILLLFRFFILIDEEWMINYKWQIVALMPEMIEYKSIKNVRLVNKHCVEIEHNRISRCYVLNATKLYNILLDKMPKQHAINDD